MPGSWKVGAGGYFSVVVWGALAATLLKPSTNVGDSDSQSRLSKGVEGAISSVAKSRYDELLCIEMVVYSTNVQLNVREFF
jgi:hypothetical protein